MTESFCELRRLLRDEVARALPAGPVALLFSGGTDSLTLLWTLLDLGADVRCYTFRLRAYESADARASALACARWKVPHTLVTEDGGPVEDRLRDVIAAIGSARKTHVEVMYGYWFLLERAAEEHVFSGLQADTLYGSNKNSAIRHGRSTAAEFARYRAALLANPGQEGLAQARALAERFGKVLHTPYSAPAVRAFFLRYGWKALNSPRQKMPALTAFAERFRELAIYRRDDNMQCGSKIREHLAPYAKRYAAIYKEVFHGSR